MRRAVVYAGIGVAGAALALVLLRPPDTGGDVPERAEPVVPPGAEDEARERSGPRPEMAAKAERRLEPDARYANVAASSWTGIKRELSANPVDPEIAEAMSSLIGDLRDAYLAPDAERIAALRDRSDALRDRLRARPDLPDPIAALLARLDEAAQMLSAETNPATAPPENRP
jgi:hypothetical protein